MSEPLAAALAEVGEGRTVLLVDEITNPQEGMLCCAADRTTPDAVSFMAVNGRGLVCVVLTAERMRKLGIRLLTPETGRGQPAFGASFEASDGVTTGISARDRATTIHAAVAENAQPEDIIMPGHIFPVQARPGGVLLHAGLFEGAMDLVSLAGCRQAAAVCTVLGADGEIADEATLRRLSEAHGLTIIGLGEIVEQRLRAETLVRRISEADMPTSFGATFRAVVYQNSIDHYEHIAGQAASGIQQVALDTGIPCHFGVLTCDNEEQALARSGSNGNVGREAVEAAIETVLTLRAINPD